MTAAALMLAAFAIEAVFGWPSWLYERVRHPVVWIGALIAALEKTLNRSRHVPSLRTLLGAMTAAAVIAIATVAAYAISALLPDTSAGYAVEALIASTLLASRSLYTHVAAVAAPLAADNLPAARAAVAHIVGRDPAQLDSAALARASVESLSENASDGVIAPLFWGALLGLPGLAAYKAINTLDSMIGHRNARYRAFGLVSARIDDIVNWLPARLTGLLIAIASGRRAAAALTTMFRDARLHRSPNAGWPESAMAGGLGIRLSGPRSYGGAPTDEPWVNPQAPDPDVSALQLGLRLYVRAMGLAALVLAVAAAAGNFL